MSGHWRATGRRRAWPKRVIVGVVWTVLFFASAVCSAQTVWELTPYKIQVVIATGAGPGLTERLQGNLSREIIDRADTVIGAAWQLSVDSASQALRAKMLTRFERVDVDDLPEGWKELDKIMLLSVTGDMDGYQLVARELDVRSRLWGTTGSVVARQPSRLPRDAFALLVRGFAPLATVEAVEGKVATLRLRAARLRPRDPSLSWSRPGDVFRPVVRQSNRDGTLRAVQEIAWTVLHVESVADGQVDCQIISGLRSPLSRRRRGRIEQLALAVRPPERPTQLTLRARVAPKRPLPGYEIISLSPDSVHAERLGRTDSDGRISIQPGADPFRVLLVKSGGELLARLPLVPGLASKLIAEVPDDARRLAVEGFVTGLQENLVDLVARREVLLARARARLEADKVAEARVLVGQLRRLRTREQFAQILRQQRVRFSTPDKSVQSKIDKLFADTEELLGRYLDPADISQLDAELRSAR